MTSRITLLLEGGGHDKRSYDLMNGRARFAVRIALGISEIVTHKSNVPFLSEVFKRLHTINPDLFSRTPGAKAPKLTAIDDEGVVKDGSMTMNLYHLLE